ncbi:MAG TPA: TadE/TadG family type IV pilus assembly protein [Candidatus Binatia bacterium]|jgi:Flp pilus assembly protein TadG
MRKGTTKGQKGIAAVEFGLIMPVVFLLLFGVIEFGTAFWRQQILTSAVREGARKGIVLSTPRYGSATKTAVTAYLSNLGWDTSKAVVTCSPSDCGTASASGSNLQVSATYPTSLVVLSHLLPGVLTVNGSGDMTLSASVTMQME